MFEPFIFDDLRQGPDDRLGDRVALALGQERPDALAWDRPHGRPSFLAHSLEGGEQGFNGGDGEDGGFGAGLGGEVGAGDGDVGDQAGEDLDLAVTDVSREPGEPGRA